jgi:hypothetical protein
MELIHLTNVNLDAVIDDEDQELIAPFTWRFDGKYVVTTVPHPEGGLILRSDRPGRWKKRRSTLVLSRLIMGLQYGDPLQVDHRNHDTLDNQRSNLVILTNAGNSQNKLSLPGSSSRYRGVSWAKSCSKWHAYGMLDGKQHNLGFFAVEEEAGLVAAEWRAAHMPHSIEGRGHAPV